MGADTERQTLTLYCHCESWRVFSRLLLETWIAPYVRHSCENCRCVYDVCLKGWRKVRDCMDNATTSGPTANQLEKEFMEFADASKKWRERVRGYRAEHDGDFYVKPYRPVEAVKGKDGDALLPPQNIPSLDMAIPTAAQRSLDEAARLMFPDLGRKVRERIDEFLSKPPVCLCFSAPVDYCNVPLHAENARNARKSAEPVIMYEHHCACGWNQVSQDSTSLSQHLATCRGKR